jgi:hypothetical protein
MKRHRETSIAYSPNKNNGSFQTGRHTSKAVFANWVSITYCLGAVGRQIVHPLPTSYLYRSNSN